MLYTADDVYMKMRDQVGPGRDGFWPQHLELVLADGDRAWNPGSPTHPVAGPCTIRYTEHRDGGWDARTS